jgi:hypothetical protein
MREEVSGVTTGGERAPDGFGDRRANFVDIADVGGYQEGSGGFIGNIGTSGNAWMQKVWGRLVVYRER